MPNGDGWKETFRFFIKELEEVYLPFIKQMQDRLVPPLLGRPQDVGEVPQPVPAPTATAPYMPPIPPIPYDPPMHFVAGEPPTGPPAYDPPDWGPVSPDRTPFPPWDPMLPYGYDTGTPTPLQIEPGPPTPWWGEVFPEASTPWWRYVPPEIYQFDTRFVQAPPIDLERKA